jgi:hypothetical protein
MDRLAEETHVGSGLRFGEMNRKYRRAGIKGFVGDIADGNLVIGGIIEDISIGGFKITHIPDWFSADKLFYTAILSGGGKHYRLLAKPCWKKKGEMGFKILDAPWGWVELTMNEIPEFDYEDGFCFEA